MSGDKKTPDKVVGRGKPGPGRPKGLQNKLTRSVKEAFEAAFNTLQKDPKAKLTKWARANPTDFYKLAARLIPADMKITGKLTLEQLVEAAKAGDESK